MNKKAIVISAFPGCGKTYYFNHHRDDIKVLDSDSSQFSWIYHEDGTKERNPDFPNNYIQHIKDNMDKQDIIFVSSHEQVRQALRGIPLVIVFPSLSMKDEWRQRLIDRGSPIEFVKLVMDNWNTWISNIWTCDDDVPLYKYRLTDEHPYLDKYVIDQITNDVKCIDGFNV